MLFSSFYGISKLAVEHYCRVFYEIYGLPTVSLRYFTVYSPRMHPSLAISIFIKNILANEPITVCGDIEQTRDFTYIDDIVRVNRRLFAKDAADGYTMSVGSQWTTVNDLIAHLRDSEIWWKRQPRNASEMVYSDKQKGDAEHTLADSSLAGELVGYRPEAA